ncbi:hypothetical protein [Sphingomonas sp. AX6]|uniref:hypothetical protein n=1 Tax=Sphingomonas sp. AX6 TaxID=2653171 RepID=UPI0012F467DA|nr:hypothetical protein [Sphingomonas sp. AX6]VXC91907.1 conserved hypothetical protein [Sphingomonas sp. AX6]
MIDHYAWAGGTEAWWKHGKAGQPLVIAALPPFEEANRTRALMMRVLMQLTVHGISVALPDLPGTGESLVATQDARLSDWQAAYAAAVEEARRDHPGIHSIAIRAGALIDAQATVASRWHLSPQDGLSLHRDLGRIAKAAAIEDGDTVEWPSQSDRVEVAGNFISNDLLVELQADSSPLADPIRVVRLTGDPAPADRHVDGAPLWRRAEPDQDLDLADALADDIADWIAQCAR